MCDPVAGNLQMWKYRPIHTSILRYLIFSNNVSNNTYSRGCLRPRCVVSTCSTRHESFGAVRGAQVRGCEVTSEAPDAGSSGGSGR